MRLQRGSNMCIVRGPSPWQPTGQSLSWGMESGTQHTARSAIARLHPSSTPGPCLPRSTVQLLALLAIWDDFFFFFFFFPMLGVISLDMQRRVCLFCMLPKVRHKDDRRQRFRHCQSTRCNDTSGGLFYHYNPSGLACRTNV